jgi:hypothetical protein
MYFITTIDSKDGDTRCVGYYTTFEKAEEAVIDNACDINETCYDYCVIENISEGLYQYDQSPTWYKWNDLDEVYEKIDYVPEPFKHTVGFGIG